MLLQFGHMAVSQLMAEPDIALSDAEARAYSKAVSEFMRWHVPAFEPNGKRGSEWNLALVMGTIYIPKALTIVGRRRRQALQTVPQPGMGGGGPDGAETGMMQ